MLLVKFINLSDDAIRRKKKELDFTKKKNINKIIINFD